MSNLQLLGLESTNPQNTGISQYLKDMYTGELPNTTLPKTQYGLGDLYTDFSSGLSNLGSALGQGVGFLQDNAQGIGLGLSAYNTFFGQGKDKFDAQMKNYKQIAELNDMKLKNQKALNDAYAQNFGGGSRVS